MTPERDGITDEPQRAAHAPQAAAPGAVGPTPFRVRSGMDATFGDTRMGTVVAFSVLCPPVAVVLGLIGMFACQDEAARRKALWMTLVAAPLAAGLAYLAASGN